MELNYNTMAQSESKSMAESISELYESACKIFTIHCKLNDIAMSRMQAMGYNGFKRWHRCRAREFLELKLRLANELFDKFRISPTFKNYDLSYSLENMEEHLKSWDKAILDAMEELGTLNKKYYDLTGMNNCTIEKAITMMVDDYEKVGRLFKRFSESDWLTLDMHIVDDKLHEKYKQKEIKYGFKY